MFDMVSVNIIFLLLLVGFGVFTIWYVLRFLWVVVKGS